MTMKFYMTPGSCSTGIHVLLEEIGAVFQVYFVNLLEGDQYKEEYLAVNPKATIPTLVLADGSALTDFQSIAWWLARAHPRRALLPESAEDQARVIELMNYAVGTLHGQGFARIFTTDSFTPNSADHDAVKAKGHDIVERGFAVVNQSLANNDYATERFSIADAALFYVEFWADRIGIPLPQHVAAHYRRLLQRPAVRQVLQEEGYAAALRE